MGAVNLTHSVFTIMETKKIATESNRKMRKWHKWGGLFFSFFLLMFCFSGLLLNHRHTLSSIDLPRKWLPSAYHYQHWNLGSVKGGITLDANHILLYGANGIWKTDIKAKRFSNYTNKIKSGADNHYISNIVRTKSGTLFCASTFDIYKLNYQQNSWTCLTKSLNIEERLTDIATQGDSLIVQTRSALYIATPPYKHFSLLYLQPTANYQPSVKTFRTLWTLHSGELLGSFGMFFIDCLGVVCIVLCITGLVLSFFPKWIYKAKKKGFNTKIRHNILQKASVLHNKLGVYLLFFLMVLTLTGSFLRPPLLISIVNTRHSPIPFTIQDTPNAWFDKLRTIRYDSLNHQWLLYTSEGFYTAKTLKDTPKKLDNVPPVGFMGTNVLHQMDKTHWIVGSFSGLYKWNSKTGKSYNLYTKQLYKAPKKMSMPDFTYSVSGYCNLFNGKTIVFDYNRGAENTNKQPVFVSMPAVVRNGNISLWHTALEVHVGRIYTILPSIVINMFIFLAGTFMLSVLISGYVIYKKRFCKKVKK